MRPAPRDLVAWKVDVNGDDLVVLEWSVRRAAPSPAGLRALTKAERAIVALLLRGKSNVAIAKARGTHLRTVANQVASIFRKLGVSARSELVVRATTLRATRVPSDT